MEEEVRTLRAKQERSADMRRKDFRRKTDELRTE